MKLLYLDDDPNDLALMGIAIDKLDLDIWLFTGPDGQHGINYLTGTASFGDRQMHPLPDIVLLDLHMQQTSGFDFLQWRLNSAFRDIPVIAFSASVNKAEEEKALRLGAHKYLSKPVGFDELKQVVREIYQIWEDMQKGKPGTTIQS